MRTLSKVLLVSVVLCSCGKNSAQPEPTAAPAPTAKVPGAPVKIPGEIQSTIDAQKSAGAKKLSDELLKKFLVYRQEMLSSMALAMDIAQQGMQAAGGDAKKLQAMARDDRIKLMNEANEKALKKSGLTMTEVAELTGITTEYYARRGAIQSSIDALARVRKQIEAAKAAGKQPSSMDATMEGVYAKQAAEFETFKKGFAAKYGDTVVALLEKHAPAYLEVQKKQMEAVLSSMKKPTK